MAKTAREQIGVDLPEPELPVVQVQEETPDRPEWLPEKFKDASDFAKSYQELERELHSRGEKERMLEQRLESMETLINTINEKPEPQQQTQNPNFNEQLAAAYETDPVGTMVFLAQNVAAQTVDQALRSQRPQDAVQAQLQGEMVSAMAQRTLEAKYEDWDDYRDKIASAIGEDPSLLPDESLNSVNTAARRMEAIYKQVKFDDLSEKLSRGELGTQSSDLSSMKRQAQTVTGGVGRPGEASEADAKIERLIAAAKNSSYAAWRT